MSSIAIDAGVLHKGSDNLSDMASQTSYQIALGAYRFHKKIEAAKSGLLSAQGYNENQLVPELFTQIANVNESVGYLASAGGAICSGIMKKDDDQQIVEFNLVNKTPHTIIILEVDYDKGCYTTEIPDILMPNENDSLKFSINHDYDINDITLHLKVQVLNVYLDRNLFVDLTLRAPDNNNSFGLSAISVSQDTTYGQTAKLELSDQNNKYNTSDDCSNITGAWFVSQTDYPNFGVVSHLQRKETTSRAIQFTAFSE
ncbi:hypothetical protein SIL08_05585 [Scandinavium sp. V105_16]|uniref:Uncharacterized protein n=1 Tax=Scandinavium lactucae TaxID=3095028 RepID=A0AAJ2S3A6_9ENTR|nr:MULTISPECIES: hypothetical protein [unclassified Scandinavium]MDX6019762.1 hypothetical protein [Scandinavium sp. V105_16]MDX6032865.1 hypothetical protein [Scandinavium sp. V105_12]